MLRYFHHSLTEIWWKTLLYKTSTGNINFWCQSLKTTYVPHYLNRVKTNVDNKTISYSDSVLNGPACNAVTRHPVLELQSSTHFFLWAYYCCAQAIILFTYTNNPRLMRSVCTCSLGIGSRYSGKRRKSQKQKQTRHDITHVLCTQKVSLLN